MSLTTPFLTVITRQESHCSLGEQVSIIGRKEIKRRYIWHFAGALGCTPVETDRSSTD
jgi:hypothetical protein